MPFLCETVYADVGRAEVWKDSNGEISIKYFDSNGTNYFTESAERDNVSAALEKANGWADGSHTLYG